MCKYCEMSEENNYGYQFGEENIISFGTYGEDPTLNICVQKQYSKNPVLLIESDSINQEDGAYYIPIKCCPMCGEEL